MNDALERARDLVDRAERITVLTGAGISTDSGIPDFRGPNGVWTKSPEAMIKSDISYYLADPEIRKRSWRMRLETWGRERQPNPGHRALVSLEQHGKLQMLVTQNVDGLHAKAGTDLDRLVEIHGTTREVVCLSCEERAPIERALDRVRAGEDDPPCRSCGGILKTAVVSFGQQLVRTDLLRAFRAAESCDLLMAIGTRLEVTPAADLVPIARQSGAALIILNDQPTMYDDLATVVLHRSISDVLPWLCRAEDAGEVPVDGGRHS